MVFALAILAPGVADAEPRLDEFAYKGSHNSYDLGPIDAQLDDWNVWQIELDLNACADCRDILVAEHCDEGKPLRGYLDELMRSKALSERVTFVWFNQKENLERCPRWIDDLRETIEASMEPFGGTEMVYRSDEFRGNDGSRWPSLEDLVSRGKHLILVIELTPPQSGTTFEDFFVAVDDDHVKLADNLTAVFINREDGGPSPHTRPQPSDPYMWRGWDIGCCNGFNHAMQSGMNLLSIDEIMSPGGRCPLQLWPEWTFESGCDLHCYWSGSECHRPHAPVPLVVDWTSGQARGDGQFGTFAFPFETVQAGVARAEAGTAIVIRAGSYPQPVRLDKAARIRGDGGMVTLGR